MAPITRRVEKKKSENQQITAFFPKNSEKFNPQSNITSSLLKSSRATKRSAVDEAQSISKNACTSKRVDSPKKNTATSSDAKNFDIIDEWSDEFSISGNFTPKRCGSNRDASIKNSGKAKDGSLIDPDAAMAAELESLADARIGHLSKYPSDSDEADTSEIGLNLSQGSGRGEFIGRTQDIVNATEDFTDGPQDTLNIHVHFNGFSNLCNAKNVYVMSPRDSSSRALADLQCSRFELIFLLAPTHLARSSLLRDFYNRYGDTSDFAKRFAVDARRLNAILHHILQAYDYDELKSASDQSTDEEMLSELPMSFSADNDSTMSDNSVAPVFNALFPQYFNSLSRLASEIARRCAMAAAERNDDDEETSPGGSIDWHVNRKDLCLINLDLFFSLIPMMDFSGWKSGKISTLFLRFAVIYMDELASGLRATIVGSMQMIIDVLDDSKTIKTLDSFFSALARIGVDCRGILLFISGLLSQRFFQPTIWRFHFLKAFFKHIQDEVGVSLTLLPAVAETDTKDKKSNEVTSLQRPIREATSGIIDLFIAFSDVACRLIKRPTDMYVAMQLLGLCITDSVIKKEHSETLYFMREVFKDAMTHMKRSRIDELILRSMSDVSHRIGMVLHRRRAFEYEKQIAAASRYNYSSSSSDNDDSVVDLDGYEPVGSTDFATAVNENDVIVISDKE